MRLAQQSVDVNVIGDDKVGTFRTVEAAAYVLIHEQDLAAFIKARLQLKALLARDK